MKWLKVNVDNRIIWIDLNDVLDVVNVGTQNNRGNIEYIYNIVFKNGERIATILEKELVNKILDQLKVKTS
jgi:hypothetical protein